MVTALDSGASGPGSSPAGDIVLCSWARHLTLTVPLSTQVFKWVPAKCWWNLTNCGGVTCDGVASRPGEVEILPAASCYRKRDKLRKLSASSLQGVTYCGSDGKIEREGRKYEEPKRASSFTCPKLILFVNPRWSLNLRLIPFTSQENRPFWYIHFVTLTWVAFFFNQFHRRTGIFLPGGAVNHLPKKFLQVAQILWNSRKETRVIRCTNNGLDMKWNFFWYMNLHLSLKVKHFKT